MRAATNIMNDDLEAAEAGLSDGKSTFHKVGQALSRRTAYVWRLMYLAARILADQVVWDICSWAKAWSPS